jgi:hypothetical protein
MTKKTRAVSHLVWTPFHQATGLTTLYTIQTEKCFKQFLFFWPDSLDLHQHQTNTEKNCFIHEEYFHHPDNAYASHDRNRNRNHYRSSATIHSATGLYTHHELNKSPGNP